RRPQVEGHWHTLFEGFATSSLDFYELVKSGIARREIPDLAISQVEWKESGLGSGKRTYLRVSREGLNFDICAAPFGTGYFFSWWLARIPRILLDFAFLFGCFFAQWIISILLLALCFYVRYGDSGIEPTVVSMPITGWLYGFIFRPNTYFNEDTAIMFR